MNVSIRAQNAPWYRGINLHIGTNDGLVRVKDVVLEKYDPMTAGSFDPVAPLSLDPAQAQTLMDDLWHCGIRPTEGTGSAGAMAATQRHLEDLRKVAFHALKITPSP
jgi:hypothetical protein